MRESATRTDVDSEGVYQISIEEFEHSEADRWNAGGESVNHRRFIWEVIGKIGPPLFSAALVACLLSGRFEPLHGVLLAGALAMIAASHWHDHHSRGTTLSR